MKVVEFHCLVLFLILPQCIAYSQPPPDSLLRKIVFFTRVVYDIDDPEQRRAFEQSGEMREQRKYPQASGFLLSTDSNTSIYVVTAKHVIQFPDTLERYSIHYLSDGGRFSMVRIVHKPISSDIFLRTPDSLSDIILLRESARHGLNSEHWSFHFSDILTPTEFDSLRIGQKIFYIGMYPDSIRSPEMWYWCPPGVIERIYPGDTAIDRRTGSRSRIDFVLRIAGEGGVSGAPVLVEENGSFKIVGVLNGHYVDSSGTNLGLMYGTAGYRILDVLWNKTGQHAEK